MELHANAALSWSGRRRLCALVVDQGWTVTAAAEAAGVSVRCARKWVGRYRLEGLAGLHDRSSSPRRVANRTGEDRIEAIVKLRRLRFTAAEIAETLAMALSTVSGILTRLGLGKLGRLGLEQPVRYERSRLGELVHIEVKKLGRIEGGAGKRVRGGGRRHSHRTYTDAAGTVRSTIGWEYVHVAVDDYSRLAYVDTPRRESSNRDRLPPSSRCFLPTSRRHCRAVAHRQRLVLPRHPARARLPTTRHPPSPHSALPATDKRKGRTLHPHPPQRLGLRSDLRLKPRTQHSS